MCIGTCLAYTGVYTNLDECPIFHELRYDQDKLRLSRGTKKVARQTFHTIPIGSQL
ncbi:hypothetical protein SERLA73DRAFT_39163, partial [Serpula lacrymans var. lacrymans S7.3]